jgi:fructuronate reductase
MKFTRLGQGLLESGAPGLRLPRYDRRQLRPGILHIGAGAFHRCHQAEWTDDALEAEFGDWGIIAANLRAPDLGAMLGDQDNLFCRELRDTGLRERRIVGSIVRTHSVLDGSYDPYRLTLGRALEDAASPRVRVISMTVTEKGYCHIPATGELNPDHPDIVHDIADPAHPLSVPGFVLRALALRRKRRVPFPTILSCDNVPDNGATLRRCVIGLARLTDPALADHIERHGIFLNTMVDRIVPATRPVDIEGFAADTVITDYGLVVGEPFRMWVIENPTGAELPPWHRAGAMVVDEVVPFELMKMRILNGIQTNVSALGLIGGIAYMSDVMADEAFRAFARRTMLREVLPGLPPVPGVDLPAYVEQSITRLQNPELRHGTAQIVTDGSQKIRQRLLEPIRACLKRGLSCDGLLIGVAAWMQTATGTDLAGKAHTAADPYHAETRAIAEHAGSDIRALVRGLLSIRAIFGDDLVGNTALEIQLAGYLGQLRERGVTAVVREHADG